MTTLALRDADGDVPTEYLEWDDALGAAKLSAIMTGLVGHPALAPLIDQPSEPSPQPVTPHLPTVVLAKLICALKDSPTPFRREDGEQQWHTDCLAVQRLIFLAHGYHLAWRGASHAMSPTGRASRLGATPWSCPQCFWASVWRSPR